MTRKGGDRESAVISSDEDSSSDNLIKKGSLELFENIFEDRLEDKKPYSKGEIEEFALLNEAEQEDEEVQERKLMIQELIDNIFDSEKQTTITKK